MVGALAIAVLAGLSTWVFAMVVGLGLSVRAGGGGGGLRPDPADRRDHRRGRGQPGRLADSLTAGIACIVFFVIYQQVENYLIYPNVMRRSVKVSDVAAVSAALLGVGLFGVIGALMAIPTVAAVQLIVREVVNPSMEQK